MVHLAARSAASFLFWKWFNIETGNMDACLANVEHTTMLGLNTSARNEL